jgi:hypothetical protein
MEEPHDSLIYEARITSYIPLLAARRVLNQLLPALGPGR